MVLSNCCVNFSLTTNLQRVVKPTTCSPVKLEPQACECCPTKASTLVQDSTMKHPLLFFFVIVNDLVCNLFDLTQRHEMMKSFCKISELTKCSYQERETFII